MSPLESQITSEMTVGAETNISPVHTPALSYSY